MFRNICNQSLKLTLLSEPSEILIQKLPCRWSSSDNQEKWQPPKGWFKKASRNRFQDYTAKDLTVVEVKEKLQTEFSDYFEEGKFITRISYVDFVDQAAEKLDELGLEKNLEAYKEILKIFPPGKYCKKSNWDIGLFHAPQQLCAIRLLEKMEYNKVRPDKEIEKIVIAAFSKFSNVWLKIARMLYWTMKGSNINPYPLPEKLPEKTHEIAKLAIMRMSQDPRAIISIKNTSSLPNVIDRTWIVQSQSPLQQEMIERLDPKTILYIEEAGTSYVGTNFLSYFTLKLHDSEEVIAKRNEPVIPSFNYNKLKMQFFGKPIKEKLEEINSINQVGDGHILGMAITGTSSHDSVLSWLKLMQQRNPNLKNINIVFKLKRPVSEIVEQQSSVYSEHKR